jgi:hypothetical protein
MTARSDLGQSDKDHHKCLSQKRYFHAAGDIPLSDPDPLVEYPWPGSKSRQQDGSSFGWVNPASGTLHGTVGNPFEPGTDRRRRRRKPHCDTAGKALDLFYTQGIDPIRTGLFRSAAMRIAGQCPRPSAASLPNSVTMKPSAAGIVSSSAGAMAEIALASIRQPRDPAPSGWLIRNSGPCGSTRRSRPHPPPHPGWSR